MPRVDASTGIANTTPVPASRSAEKSKSVLLLPGAANRNNPMLLRLVCSVRAVAGFERRLVERLAMIG